MRSYFARVSDFQYNYKKPIFPKFKNRAGMPTTGLKKKKKKKKKKKRVNALEESVENCYVDGVTIVGVPFCGLKGIEIKTMEI